MSKGEEHACREGTARVPDGFVPCCKRFAQHTRTCIYDIRYECWRTAWVIVAPIEAGGGGITITFCPHCGTPLSHPNTN